MSEHAHAPRGGRAGQIDSTGLRPGWTTGACATAATRAAWEALLTGTFPDPVDITLPRGQRPTFALTDERLGGSNGDGSGGHRSDGDGLGGAPWAEAAITKDAGDDPDVTHLAVVRVRVRRGPAGSGTRFVAGRGVGTVTLPGLPLEVGEPAINPVPRQMIRHTLREAEAVAAGRAEALAWDAGPEVDAVVEISVDQGEEMARHTWNPRLGIVGGLSILGTTGIVVPYSCSAWIDSIRRGIDVAEALGIEHVAGCTGSTSERVVTELYALPEQGLLDMGDFVGAVLKHLRQHPRPRLTIAGGFAKLSKLAAGHLDLHSGRSRVDPAHLTRLAESCGAPTDLVARLAGVNTGLEALQLSQAAGVPLGDAVAEAARDQALRVLDGAPVVVDVVCIDRAGTIVGRSAPLGPGQS